LGVMAPASPVNSERLQKGVDVLRALGYEVVVAEQAWRRQGLFAGSDAERAAAARALLTDPSIDGVVFARGGYGSMRLLPLLQDVWPLLRDRPKALVGFSDVTALHLACNHHGLVSLHGPLVETLAPEPDGTGRTASCAYLAAMLRGGLGMVRAEDAGTSARAVVSGRARGRLIGGNLSLLAATVGTPWEVQTEGAILLVEDVGEPSYRLDRYLAQLSLAGKLQAVAGVVVGELVGCGGGEGSQAEEVLAAWLQPLGVPVAMGWPVGHGREILTLPLGRVVELDADQGTLRLLGEESDMAVRTGAGAKE